MKLYVVHSETGRQSIVHGISYTFEECLDIIGRDPKDYNISFLKSIGGIQTTDGFINFSEVDIDMETLIRRMRKDKLKRIL